ncbi:MAG TPA: hypothetical protein VF531_09040 [Bacillota bacterium]
MSSFKFGINIGKGETAKIRIKINISRISDEIPKKTDARLPDTDPGSITTLPLPFPQLSDEPGPLENVSIPKGQSGFWQQLFSGFTTDKPINNRFFTLLKTSGKKK